MTYSTHFFDRLSRREPIVQNGGCGTEIQRRGVKTYLPLWSASALETAPDVVRQIHRDYIDAGAEIIITNTFRTNIRTFQRTAHPENAREYTLKACALARQAREESGKDVIIGGCIAPVEDCYKLELVPTDDELEKEHDAFARFFVEGAVDCIYLETMNCLREAVAASRAAAKTGLPFFVSFLCTPSGDLFDGSPLEQAVQAVLPYGPKALFVNCRPLSVIDVAVRRLLKISPLPVGAHANGLGHPDDLEGWIFEGEHPEQEYARYAEQWWRSGVAIVGGCCGTTPEYIKTLASIRDSLVSK